MNKQTKILLGVGALAVVGYLVFKSSKKTTPETPTLPPILPTTPSPKVYAKDAAVLNLIGQIDEQIGLNEWDDSLWASLYHEIFNMAELNVSVVNNVHIVSTKESSNVSKDVQLKAIASLNKISQFNPTTDFWI